MAEAVVSGVSLRAIVRDLNARKVPTSTGRTWKLEQVREPICRRASPGCPCITAPRGRGHMARAGPRETWEAAAPS